MKNYSGHFIFNLLLKNKSLLEKAGIILPMEELVNKNAWPSNNPPLWIDRQKLLLVSGLKNI